jgi:F-type H+-transporting ATPase subunit epsilon
MTRKQFDRLEDGVMVWFSPPYLAFRMPGGVRTIDGRRGVLAGHEGMICCLTAGEVRFRVNGETRRAIVSEGFVEIMPTFVKLFADSIERPEEIDVLRAEAAKARAQERLRQQLSTKQYIHTHAALKRAMARIKAANK